jgi:hypothetical protein
VARADTVLFIKMHIKPVTSKAHSILLLFILLTSCYSQTNVTSNKIALVIGNANYKAASTLENPENDATDMAAVLTKLGYDASLHTDVSKSGLERAIWDFQDRAHNDVEVALLYYARHRMEINGINYLIPVDADIIEPRHIALWYQRQQPDGWLAIVINHPPSIPTFASANMSKA